MDEVFSLFLGVMGLQEAKNHELLLAQRGIALVLKTNPQTCSSGCKVTVEVWAREQDIGPIQEYFNQDYLKNLKGHMPNFEAMASVFDPNASEVICQACGARFRPDANQCPDCGLVY